MKAMMDVGARSPSFCAAEMVSFHSVIGYVLYDLEHIFLQNNAD